MQDIIEMTKLQYCA